jgi:hypothetical protein
MIGCTKVGPDYVKHDMKMPAGWKQPPDPALIRGVEAAAGSGTNTNQSRNKKLVDGI